MKKLRTPEESRIVGNFGEYALAYYLSKKGINVIRADTVFFDLIVKDKKGIIFPRDEIIGVSVKLRDRSFTTPSCTIQHEDFEQISDYGSKWNIKPYFCHMIIYSDKEDGRVLQGFIFSQDTIKKYFSEKKREFAVSFSKLRDDIGKEFIQDKNYFRWKL
jgi:hypothetical protein